MFRNLKVAAVVAGAMISALLPTGASAVSLNVQAGPGNFGGLFGAGNAYSNVTINSVYRSGTFAAGGFRVTDGISDFIAWCLDIEHNLSTPVLGNYTETAAPFTNTTRGNLGATVVSNIEKLFEANFNSTMVNNGTLSAAFQLALWELVYETSGTFDLTVGTFKSTTAAIAAQANLYLGNLANAVTNFDLTFYQSQSTNPARQNLVTVSPVPLPPGLSLFGAGLLMLGYLGRRRKRAAQPT